MSEVVKRLKLNKFSLFVTFVIAFLAAFFTLFFAVLEGIKSNITILLRMCVSFSFFAVIGYFVAGFIEKEYLSVSIQADCGQDNQAEEAGSQNSSIEQSLNEQEDDSDKENNINDVLTNNSSFDKIIVADNDDDE